MEGSKHEFKYRYTCEKCGKQTEWIKTEFHEETAANNVVEIIETIADKDKFKKQLQKFKVEVENGKYGYHFGGGSSCPYCGVRQSWLPVTRQSTMRSPMARVVTYMGINLFLGLIFLIIIMVCKANKMLRDFDDNLILLIAFVLFPAIGIFFAIRRNKINAKIDKQLIESTTVQNKPEIDWNEA